MRTTPGSPSSETLTIRDVAEYVIVDDFEARKNGKTLSVRQSDGRVLVDGLTDEELVERYGDPWERLND